MNHWKKSSCSADNSQQNRPLEGMLVLDFSQFLSGPSAALRLADLGARVIKIERPVTGDICRTLYISNLELDGDSSIFHAINRNKESFAANFKNAEDMKIIKKLIEKADVLIENFRPGVMDRLGLDYKSVEKLNPKLVYAEITGYGADGPWKDMPGQDLLVQALSGLTWLNGDEIYPPTPFGLAVVDMMAGAHLAQGILAALVKRTIKGAGSFVQVSLMESILDFQFEGLTTYLNDGGQRPQRSKSGIAHAYLGVPYGLYKTTDGYISLAMGSLSQLADLLECSDLKAFEHPRSWFGHRNEIKQIIASRIKMKSTEQWLTLLEAANYWCAEVLSWERLMAHEGFRVLDMLQEVRRKDGLTMRTTRCPIRIDGNIYKSTKGSPRIGEDTLKIRRNINEEN
jgi:CoA:oxalate CoA-transferase